MSGQYAHHNGMMSNGSKFKPTTKCLGETFRDAGYEMGYLGLAKDPWETNNLVTLQPKEVQEADARLAKMMKKYGDSWSASVTTGDLKSWLPGASKQQSQNLGVPYPGEQKPNARGKKAKASSDKDDG